MGIGQLGRRIIAAFLAIAVASVLVDVTITTVTGTGAFDQFVRQQADAVTRAVATAAGIAYADDGGWQYARLAPVLDVAGQFDAGVQITDMTGRIVATSPLFARHTTGPMSHSPVFAAGRRVGSVTLRFGNHGVTTNATRFLSQRWPWRVYAALIAVMLALLVSVAIARRITAPIDRTVRAIRARGGGDRDIRIKNVRGMGELGELVDGFNEASDAIDRQERARRNLVADVAHELRTPVAVLQAGHEAMLDGIIEATPENLGSLRDEVLRLGRLLDDLRALAAAEAAALQLRLADSDLADIAAEAAAALTGPVETAGLTLRTELASARVHCEADRMREVIANLLTNAMKYTSAGGAVTLRTGSDPEARAWLAVSDTGIGIPADELPHVTERFFRGRQSSAMAGGSGFGLTIVVELVRAQHGSVDITSEPGVGTEVTVTMPPALDRPDGPDGNTPHWRPLSRPGKPASG
jgi:two-component system, OmpR family, sensor histidine kinase BaeS